MNAGIVEEKDMYRHSAQRPKEKEKDKEDLSREARKDGAVRDSTQERQE